jgi:hypothetical protein
MRVLRNLDLFVLALALPVFVAAGLSLLGYIATTGAWLAARGVESWAQARAARTGSRRSAMRARAATLIGRLYLIGLTVFAAGMLEHDAGVAAGALALVVFTVHLGTEFFAKGEEAGL